jgi:preprotein translocase SecE subunit
MFMAKAGGNGSTLKPPQAPRAVREARAQNFARGLASEFRRITWPSRQEWVAATVLTIGLVVGIGIYTYGIDQLCTWLFSLVHR